jgi:hypothetical protein
MGAACGVADFGKQVVCRDFGKKVGPLTKFVGHYRVKGFMRGDAHGRGARRWQWTPAQALAALSRLSSGSPESGRER